MNKKAELPQRWPRDAPYNTGALKIIESPWVRLRLLFPKILMGFVPIDLMNAPTKFEVRSFTRSCDNGVPQKLGSPCLCPRSLFSKTFNGLLFGWTLWMNRLNLKSVALGLPVPEIIGSSLKLGQSLDTPTVKSRLPHPCLAEHNQLGLPYFDIFLAIFLSVCPSQAGVISTPFFQIRDSRFSWQ